MGLKPDHWIRKMALEQRMIEPFEDNQVRNGVISYGVSSYGYDIRVADEFKIFTNVYSAIVDPKNFDTKSMVDYKGDVCIIPPNSFALAKTIEYFRIPRKVLTVCLGKCLTGDTRVVNAETGEFLPLKDFVASRSASTVGLDQWALGTRDVTAHVDNGLQPVYQLTTRTGLKIKATATHPFRTFSGWKPLNELFIGERIAVARSCPVFGKEDWPEHEAVLLGLMLSDGQCHTPGHSPRFTGDDPALVDALVTAAKSFGCEVSPVGHFGYNLVNHRGRGGIAEKNRLYAWLEGLGCNVRSSEKFVPSIVFTARRERVAKFLQALFSGDGSVYSSEKGLFLEYYSTSERLAYDVRHLLLRFGIFALVRSKNLPGGGLSYRVQITDREMIQRFRQEIGFVPGSRKQKVLDDLAVRNFFTPRRRSNFDTMPAEAWDVMRQSVYQTGLSLRSIQILATQPDQSLPYSTARQAARAIWNPEFSALVDADVVWDTVQSIEPAGVERVYDLTIPSVHNFLANDLIVHNSTYARCFRGDTRVALVDGSAPTLEEMSKRSEDGEIFWGYSIGPFGQIMVTLLEAPRYIGKDHLVEIMLDNGESIFCTDDHRFLTRDGRMVAAEGLRPGSSLMPLYRQLARGYEMVYQPIDGHLVPTHRLADEWNLRQNIYEDVQGTHRHHLDGDRRNNRPWNIHRLSMLERYCDPLERAHQSEWMKAAWAKDDGSRRQKQAEIARRINLRPEISTEMVREALDQTGSIRGAARLLNCDRSVFRRFPEVIQEFRGLRLKDNHKVISIHEVPGDHDVYCLSVPEAGNFALEAGVFVSNCGIIVNVTPFEPEWEGFVTLEISNTTPLPAKIYANEGIAQVLFFEADDECEISYADKKGKYQGQQSIVLPKL